MAQSWHDLLFAHWPVPVDDVRPLVPSQLELDTWDGSAWVGVIPFHMSNVHLRLTPNLPRVSAFPELNVRTYVKVADKPGVYFFSLDAGSRFAVAVARRWFHLPYFHARMHVQRRGKTIRYASRRVQRGAPPADLVASYAPVGDIFHAEPGSLEHWLTERYCLYTLGSRQEVCRGEIHHAPWLLQPAEADIRGNTMTASLGIELPDTEPLLQYARRLDVVVWPLNHA